MRCDEVMYFGIAKATVEHFSLATTISEWLFSLVDLMLMAMVNPRTIDGF